MVVSCPHDLIEQIPLVCHKKQSLGFLIQPSDRIDTDGIIQIIRHDRLLTLLLRAAHDASGFMK